MSNRRKWQQTDKQITERNEDKPHVISQRRKAIPPGRELDYIASSLQDFVAIDWSDNRKTDNWLTDTPQNRRIIGSTKNRFLYGDCIIRTCRYWANLDTTKYQKCPQAKRTRKAQALNCTISEFPNEAQRAKIAGYPATSSTSQKSQMLSNWHKIGDTRLKHIHK